MTKWDVAEMWATFRPRPPLPLPLPGWTVAMMAGTEAAIVGHEVEGTYEGWQSSKVKEAGSLVMQPP